MLVVLQKEIPLQRKGSYKVPGVHFPYGLIEREDGNQVVLYDGHGQLKSSHASYASRYLLIFNFTVRA